MLLGRSLGKFACWAPISDVRFLCYLVQIAKVKDPPEKAGFGFQAGLSAIKKTSAGAEAGDYL